MIKKLLLICFFSSLLTPRALAQDIAGGDFHVIIPLLQEEDFKTAFERSSQLLTAMPNDSSAQHAILLYMNIFSAAGMVSKSQLTYDSLTAIANKWVGQYMIMPSHPCASSSGHGFNLLQFSNDHGKVKGFTHSANHDATSILCFEYFKYLEVPDTSNLIGHNVRCGGRLEAFETNPNKSTIWIIRLHFSDAVAIKE